MASERSASGILRYPSNHDQRLTKCVSEVMTPSLISFSMFDPHTLTNETSNGEAYSVSFLSPFHHSNTTLPSSSAATCGASHSYPVLCKAACADWIQSRACSIAMLFGASTP